MGGLESPGIWFDSGRAKPLELLAAVAHLLREISVGFLGHGQRLRDTPSLEPGRVLTLLVRTIAAGLAGVTPAMTLFPPTPNRRWEKPILKQIPSIYRKESSASAQPTRDEREPSGFPLIL